MLIATAANTIQTYLPKDKWKGPIDLDTMPRVEKQETEEERELEKRRANKPMLEQCLNLYDFEAVAKTTLSAQAWAYYSSGADDEITMRENRAAYQRIWFRPRILRDVTHVDYSTSLVRRPRFVTRKLTR
jgi:L-lactate dehydrogenase (cytochrome)